MADFTLVVGVDTKLSYDLMRQEIDAIVRIINKTPRKIKVQLDDTSLKTMRQQLTQLKTSVIGSGNTLIDPQGLKNVSDAAKKSVTDLGEVSKALKEIAADAANADKALNKLNNTLNQTVNTNNKPNSPSGGSVAGTKAETAALKSYTSALVQGEKRLKDWTAAEKSKNLESRNAYSTFEKSVSAMRQAFDAYDGTSARLKDLVDAIDAYKITSKETEAILRRNDDATKTFGERLTGLTNKFATWVSASQLVMQAVRAVRELVSASIELDSAFAQIEIVTGATEAELRRFKDTAVSLASELGQSVTDVVKSIEVFSRLGYSLPDASALAEYATILANVAAVSVDEATSGLTSIIKGFNLDVTDAEHVADVLITVGQKYAVSAGEMMEAYARSGAALNAANTSFEKSAGLIAAANAAVQDSSVVGTALKTVSARIRGSKSDLEELGEETGDLAEGFSKYAEELEALTGFDIMVEGTTNTYKDLYDIMAGIAAVWGRLSDTQQARVSEILGGTRQLQVISSILGNWSDAAGAYDAAMNSAGEATRANGIYMETAAAHINQFKAAFQELASNLVSADFVSFIVDIGTFIVKLLNLLAKLIDALGGLKTILITLGVAVAVFKFSSIIGFLTSACTLITDAATALGLLFGWLGPTISLLMGAPALLAAVAVAIGVVRRNNEKARQSAQEAASAFSESYKEGKESAEQYADRISELKGQIDEGKLSQEQLRDAQAELLTIQDELTDKYGKQAQSINLLAMETDEAVEAIYRLNDAMSKQDAVEFLTQDDSQIDKAISRMEKVRSFVSGSVDEIKIGSVDSLEGKHSDIWRQIQNIIAKYDKAGIGQAEVTYGPSASETYYTLEIVADAKSAEETIYGLSQDFHDLKNELAKEGINLGDIFDFEPVLERSLSNVNVILEDGEEIYDSAQKAKIANNETYSDIVNQFEEAERAFEEATSGSYDTFEERAAAIRKALDKIEAAEKLFEGTVFLPEDTGVKTFIQGLFNEIEKATEGEELKLDFVYDLAHSEDRLSMFTELRDALATFADEANDFSMTSIELAEQEVEAANGVVEGLSEEALAYIELDEVASQYNMTVEQMIMLLSDLDIINAEVTDGIGKEIANLISLSDELEGATERLKEYDDAMAASGEKGDAAKEYAERYNKFIEDWDAGRTGTNAVKYAVELFIPEDILRDLDYDVQAAGELLASDFYRAFFNKEVDIGINFGNILREMSSGALAGVVEIVENGDSFDIMISSYEELQEALGMDADLMYAFLDSLEAYGTQVMMSAEGTHRLAESLHLLDPAKSNIDKIQAAIDGLVNNNIYSETQISQILSQLESAKYIDLSGVENIGDMINEAIEAAEKVDEIEASPEIRFNLDATRGDAEEVQSIIDGIKGRTIDIFLNYVPTGAGIDTPAVPTGSSNSSNGIFGGFFNKLFGGGNAGGTKNARGGKTLVNELGPELISENGEAYIVNNGNPAVVDLSPGAIVLDAETTDKALRGSKTQGSRMGAMASGSIWDKIKNAGSKVVSAVGGVISSVGNAIGSAVNSVVTGTKNVINKVFGGNTNTSSSGGTVAPGTRTPGGVTSSSSTASATQNTITIPSTTSPQKASNATVPIYSPSGSGGSGGGYGSGGYGSSGGSSGASSEKQETWFEKLYAEHNHLLKMDKEEQADYLSWLDNAYKQAYNEGIIDLKDYRKYEEEVYKGRQEDFKDRLKDTEHLIGLEQNGANNPTVILNMYQQMLDSIQSELENAYASGLNASDDYVQYLQNQWHQYYKDMNGLREDAVDQAESQVKDLVDYRKKMLEQYIKDEVESLKDRLSYLKDFYSTQKSLLQDVYDEENYLAEQSEKRKSVSDIQNELQALEFDDSAWAQKRKLQLQQELDDAQKQLDDFERQHALSLAQDQLDAMYDMQEAAINAKIEQLNERADDPQALYEAALKDVQNNSVALYQEMIEFNNKYGSGIKQDIVDMWEEAYISLKKYCELYGELYKGISLVNATGYVPDSGYANLHISQIGYAGGTRSASPGMHRIDELGPEYVFTSSSGSRYRILSGQDKVLNSRATEFLYDFATSGGGIIPSMIANSVKSLPALSGGTDMIGEINMGDIIIQGNASERTVSEIRRAQRESVDFMLKEFNRLKK